MVLFIECDIDSAGVRVEVGRVDDNGEDVNEETIGIGTSIGFVPSDDGTSLSNPSSSMTESTHSPPLPNPSNVHAPNFPSLKACINHRPAKSRSGSPPFLIAFRRCASASKKGAGEREVSSGRDKELKRSAGQIKPALDN